MGIKNLRKSIESALGRPAASISFDQMRGWKVAVDASIYVYKFKHLYGDPLVGFRDLLSTLSSYDIVAIFFFDGKPAASKARELADRRKQKKALVAECEEARTQVSTMREGGASLPSAIFAAEEKKKRLERRVARMPTRDDYVNLKKWLTDEGIEFHQSHSDGEKACAWATRVLGCECVFTEDFDTLPYRAKAMITGVGSKEMRVYSKDEVLEAFAYSENEFIDFCLLSGSDLTPTKMKGVSSVRARKIINAFRSINSFLEESCTDENEETLKLRKKLKKVVGVPEGYMDDINTARAEFLDNSTQIEVTLMAL